MNKPQKVSIRPATGDRGAELTARLRTAIAGGGLHTLLSGGAGATVIVTGDVHADEYVNDVKNTTQTRCVATDKKGRCTKNVDVTIYERSEFCASTVSVKAVSTEGGRVIFEKSVREADASVNSKDGQPPDEVGRRLCSRAFEKATESAVRYVSPFKAMVELEFHDIDDGGETGKAIEFAKVSNFKEAKRVLVPVTENRNLPEKDVAWAKYNLAVVLWALADFPACIEQLDGAQGAIGSESEFTGLYKDCKEYLQ